MIEPVWYVTPFDRDESGAPKHGAEQWLLTPQFAREVATYSMREQLQQQQMKDMPGAPEAFADRTMEAVRKVVIGHRDAEGVETRDADTLAQLLEESDFAVVDNLLTAARLRVVRLAGQVGKAPGSSSSGAPSPGTPSPPGRST